MRRETQTVTWAYKVFEVGERVRPSSSRCPVYPGVYIVTQYFAPLCPSEAPIVWLAGRDYGIDGTYLEPAEAVEVVEEPG